MRTTKPHAEFAPGAYQGLLQVYRYTRACGLEPGLLHLVELRASQMNGCVYCINAWNRLGVGLLPDLPKEPA